MKRFIHITTAIILSLSALAVSGCASWNRRIESLGGDLGNGLNRTVIIYDAMGKQIGKYSGKFYVDYKDERVLFDDEQGKRHIIYFKTGAVIIDET